MADPVYYGLRCTNEDGASWLVLQGPWTDKKKAESRMRLKNRRSAELGAGFTFTVEECSVTSWGTPVEKRTSHQVGDVRRAK